eukprot:UN11394
MTISPSLCTGLNEKRIDLLLKHNVLPAFGHDKPVTESEVLKILTKYSSTRFHLTHCFNVQKFHHRDTGLANFTFLSSLPNLPKYKDIKYLPTVELIGDLKHVSPIVLHSVLQSKKNRNNIHNRFHQRIETWEGRQNR